ncbi:hypothetical protein [Marinoscillum furvescens]|uniref:YD repeat-containing protein n=1 Tax=Marinoscillum furvescens DSM 4134 TaxID=1122208 RepID=A0A3D9L1X3_MARFU|nr:hypothetical protein [Marinoscillum furvescens]RED98375.1 hypothetical protein C7460_11047 [Marinoscillum furvescens DSM 4134]
MKPLLTLFVLLLICSYGSAQSKKTIRNKGVSVIKTYEQDIIQGEKSMLIEKEEYFDSDGELIEEKEISEKGRIKSWIKYERDGEGNVLVETHLSDGGKQELRLEYTYENGLRVEKRYYDDRDRLYKMKKYEYQYH